MNGGMGSTVASFLRWPRNEARSTVAPNAGLGYFLINYSWANQLTWLWSCSTECWVVPGSTGAVSLSSSSSLSCSSRLLWSLLLEGWDTSRFLSSLCFNRVNNCFQRSMDPVLHNNSIATWSCFTPLLHTDTHTHVYTQTCSNMTHLKRSIC